MAMSRDRILLFLLLLAALLLFCIDLNGVPLRDWDEGTVAQVAREISRCPSWQGWIHPTLWDKPYLNKPPLLHGLIAVAYRLFGVHAWTARLPGAVLTACSVPLLYWVGRAVFPNRSTAWISAGVYLLLLPVVRHGRLAMLDGAIVCFFLFTLGCLLKSLRHPRWGYGVGLGFALMVLTKGLLGGLLLAIALLFLLWERPQHLLSPPLWQGLLLGLVPVLGWYSWQWQQYGQTFVDTGLIDQGLSRIWETVEDHQGPPWYYLLEILKYGWPWLIFWPVGWGLTLRSLPQPWAKLILTWTGAYLLPISCMGTKLPWYVYPIYPAIALTCGVALSAAWEKHRHWSSRTLALKRLPKGWSIALALIAFVGLAGMVYASPWGGEPSIALFVTFLMVACTAATAALWVWQQRSRFLPALFIGLYLALLSLMVSDHWVWELGESFPVEPIAQLVRNHVPPTAPIYLQYPYHRPSLEFYSDRPIPPAPLETLQTLWQQPTPIYILTNDLAPYTALSGPILPLGTANTWHLISNQTAKAEQNPQKAPPKSPRISASM